MPEYTITVVDTTHIQPFVFGSNALRHNVGASYLVHLVTHDWVYKTLRKLGATNVDENGGIEENKEIDKHDLVTELIYTGGGNAVILFKDGNNTAREFTRQLTEIALLHAPGLQIVVSHTDNYLWNSGGLHQVVQETINKVGRKKQNHVFSSPLLGLGVTAECQYTGFPAVDFDKKDRLVSAETKAKDIAFEQGRERLLEIIPAIKHWNFIEDFSEIGEKGESSFLAVVHADGNGMGNRIRSVSGQNDRDYIRNIRKFSRSIEIVATQALNDIVDEMIACIDANNQISGEIQIHNNKLPFRPIVFGGDDLTFVCDGRLGLALAVSYLKCFTQIPLSDNKPATARAGVAVVKSHHPFSRAYNLAEELAASAKKYIKEREAESETGLSAIDWHFATSGALLPLDEIRKREFTVDGDHHLNMRPVYFGNSHDWRSWDNFQQKLDEFRFAWWNKRNKVKDLREPLRKGAAATKAFMQVMRLDPLREIPAHPDSAFSGWIEKTCVWFDAVEAIDLYVPLVAGRKK